MKYTVCISIDGVDNFHTVMKVIEDTKGITVDKVEMVSQSSLPVKRNSLKRVFHPDGELKDVLLAYFKSKNMTKVTRFDYNKISKETGIKHSSIVGAISRLVRDEKLIDLTPEKRRN